MLTKIRKRLAREEGFTLIELLVVVLIIGILAAVAIPTFLSQKNKATDSNAQSNLKNAQTVVESYAAGNNGQYPTAASPGALFNAVSGLSTDSDATSLGSGNNPVTYISAGGSTDSYSLTALGSNSGANHYWALVVTNGAVTYGEATTAAAAITNAASNTTGLFPTVSTS